MDNENKEVLKVDMGAQGTKTVKMEFPSNSQKPRAERVEKEEPRKKKVEKVTSGKVVRRKTPLSKRFAQTFLGEDISDVGGYIVYDVLIPALKSMVSEMLHGGTDIILFGERKGNRTRRDQGRSYVSYDRVSSHNSGRRDERTSREFSHKSRARHNFDDIILSSRGEAEEVLSLLVDLTIDYGQASVSDLYDAVDITGTHTDTKYGWEDLSRAKVIRAREGYLLDLPKPIVLD